MTRLSAISYCDYSELCDEVLNLSSTISDLFRPQLTVRLANNITQSGNSITVFFYVAMIDGFASQIILAITGPDSRMV